MIIDMKQAQIKKFDDLATQVKNNPAVYVQFDSVSDFYKASWLDEFPKGTVWSCTGLDDGAEEFYALIYYYDHYLSINCSTEIEIRTGIYPSKDDEASSVKLS